MKKILYYSLVDWDWIKQRPHFIALGLAEEGFDVRVMYLHQYRRKGLAKVSPQKAVLRPIYRIPPLRYRFALINKMNQKLVRFKIAREIGHYQPDVLWLTHPLQLLDIPDTYTGQIIYDCMDNYDALGATPSLCEMAGALEEKLCRRASLIFTSSRMLYEKIQQRCPDSANRLKLLNNGCIGKLYPRSSVCHPGKIYVGYVGTIAEWFDFDLVLKSLERIPNLEYFLFGPVNVPSPPVHHRLHYRGSVAHDALFDQIKEMDCMAMPFCLNDIILSVDPVKLYEYISWQKNIVAVDYPEIQRFKGFINTYTNADEYCTALVRLGQMKEAAYSEQAVVRFLKENSWSNRVAYISDLLDS